MFLDFSEKRQIKLEESPTGSKLQDGFEITLLHHMHALTVGLQLSAHPTILQVLHFWPLELEPNCLKMLWISEMKLSHACTITFQHM